MGGPGAPALLGHLTLPQCGLMLRNDGDGGADELGGNGAGANGRAIGGADLARHRAAATAGFLTPRNTARVRATAERQGACGEQTGKEVDRFHENWMAGGWFTSLRAARLANEW